MLPYLEGHPGRSRSPPRRKAESHASRSRSRASRSPRCSARDPREVVFTSTGTEAVNTAIWGAVRARAASEAVGAHHIVTTAVEHSSVLDACDTVPRRAHRRRRRPRGPLRRRRGRSPRSAATPRSCQRAAREPRGRHGAARGPRDLSPRRARRGVLVHVDACAAAGHVPVDFAALGADLCSVTGHAWGAPKGAAALLVRRGPPGPARSSSAGRRSAPGAAASRTSPRSSGSARPRPSSSTTIASPEKPTAARRLTDAIAAAALAVDGVEPLRRSRRGAPAQPRVPRPRRRRGRADRCSVSTSAASPCTPARRARASCSSRHPCCRRWASTPTARCGSASGWPSDRRRRRAVRDGVPDRGGAASRAPSAERPIESEG